MNKARYIALTDINPGIELDDVQSMHRLLLYANEIDIEGLVAVTSCFVKRGARKKTGAADLSADRRIREGKGQS